MKKFFPLLLLVCTVLPAWGQLNVTLRSNLDYAESVNDVWGYVAPDGTEYAIVGMTTGISIVSLAEPDAPVEVGFVTGANSAWRDMKTYGEYAYAVADQGADGLTVIDLSGLPDSVSSVNHQYAVPGYDPPFVRAHNIYIDTTMGLAFTAGGDGNVNAGGMIIFDLKADPAHPPIRALGPAVYSHDVFVQDSIMYASEIYRGELALYDIHQLDSIFEIGRTRTPYTFTHNAWVDANNSTVFTTDEKANASVAAYDITDLPNLQLLDEFRPITSLNSNSVPHNVHVIDEYLSISSYSDGLRVVDASDPTNLIEVGNYDTYSGPDGGFNGSWGAYPFLPSGLTLISDRSRGLFVVDVNYKRAARLRGTVLDSLEGTPINNARVEIITDQANQGLTDATGTYATGIADAGSYLVVASATGYFSDTVRLELRNDTTLIQNFNLSRLRTVNVNLRIADSQTAAVVPGAVVTLTHPSNVLTARADSSGTVRFTDVIDYPYEVLVTAWGYQEVVTGNVFDLDTIFLDRGYEDSFTTDQGWTVQSTASRGAWERGVPTATYNVEGPGQAGEDSPFDYGEVAYVTGLKGGNSNANDVDGGFTSLRSPVIDLSDYGAGAMLTYDFWFSNISGTTEPDDSLTVALANADTTHILATYKGAITEWTRDTVYLDGLLPFTDSLRLVVTTADDRSSDHLVEAAFDNFRILDSLMLSPVADLSQPITISAALFPNPSADAFTLQYDLRAFDTGELEVYSVSGQRVHQQPLRSPQASVSFGRGWLPGLYLVRISAGSRTLGVFKVVKQ